jgi:hypothetical protein
MTVEAAIVGLVIAGALLAIYETTRLLGLTSLLTAVVLSIFQGWN